MKKLLFTLAILSTLTFQSCDKIEAPYGQSGGGVGPTPTDSIVQKVLLEDLTGFHCTNCPDGHRKAKQLHDVYGDRLILLSVHAGFFATPNIWGNPIYNYDFQTVEGTEIYNTLTPAASLPKGMVNRVPYPANIPIEVGNWASAVSIEMAKTPRAGIVFDTISYAAGSRTITGKATVKFLSTITEEVSLCFFTVEDSIIQAQLDNGVDIPQYNHMHVLRGSLNSTWGQSVGANNTAGSSQTISFSGSYTPGDAIPENSYVYALLINKSTKEVINVEEIRMIP